MTQKQIFHRFASVRCTFVLLGLYALGLGAATFIEKYHGTAAAKAWVYHAPLFLLLQGLLAVNAVCVAVRRRLLVRRRVAFLVTHAALALILLGALVTFLFGQEGVMHIREGEVAQTVEMRDGQQGTTLQLPFALELDDFILTRYPGSASPSAYESRVTVHVDGISYPARIYMNNVLDVEGYRFFQSSYDADECGTILSVSHDVVGRRISYLGYVLLAVGLLLSFLAPGSRFSRLGRRLSAMRHAAVCLCLVWPALCGRAVEGDSLPDYAGIVRRYAVPEAHARQFAALPMQSPSGRMMPVNTFASEVLRKLHKGSEVCGLDADRFLLSLLLMPDVWMHVPFIAVPGAEVADAFGLPRDYCAFVQVFDTEGNYKLQSRLEEAYRKSPARRSRLDKDLLKLDERINIFHLLAGRRMLNLFPLPGDAAQKWYAAGDDLSAFTGMDSLLVSRVLDWYLQEAAQALTDGTWTRADSVLDMVRTYQRVKATEGVDISPGRLRTEVLYNRVRIFRHCKTAYLLLGALGLLLAFGRKPEAEGRRSLAVTLLIGAAVLCLVVHACGMGVRCYLAGYAPWSNSYETMVYVSWVTALSGLCFARRSVVALSLGILFAGIILFVSELNWMDPQISPLVPVLKSPWLMFHVAVVVGAYGFFGLSCLLGLANLVQMCLGAGASPVAARRIRELTLINEMSLWVGLALMSLGTFLGAVWANESWGRYWGWDPKETWALITMVVYAMVTHLHLLGLRRRTWWLNWTSVMAFATVLMTFLGVNYLLSGMHSYGTNPNVGEMWLPLLLVTLVLLPVSAFSWRKASHLD